MEVSDLWHAVIAFLGLAFAVDEANVIVHLVLWKQVWFCGNLWKHVCELA